MKNSSTYIESFRLSAHWVLLFLNSYFEHLEFQLWHFQEIYIIIRVTILFPGLGHRMKLDPDHLRKTSL